MAELFLQQGQLGRAAVTYRRFVRTHPENRQAAQRLKEIEAQLTAPKGETMGFREHVQHIVDNVPGAVAGVVMGFDGIPIDTYDRSDGQLDISTLMTEYSSLAGQVRRTIQTIETVGPFAEVSIRTHGVTAVLQGLNEDVFIGVVMKPEALVGRARFLMRLASPHLRKELA